LHPLESRKAAAAFRTMPAAADGGIVLGRTAVLHLAVVMSAEWAAHRTPSFRSVNRKIAAQRADLLAHTGFDRRIAVFMIFVGQTVDHFHNQFADLAEFGGTEATGGAGRR